MTRADVEAVRVWRRQEQASGRSHSGSKGGEVGTNRLRSRLRHIFNWAIAEEHLEATPFKRGPAVSDATIGLSAPGAAVCRGGCASALTVSTRLNHIDRPDPEEWLRVGR